jgi:hypothetical protein
VQRLAYGGFVCAGCDRICDHLPHEEPDGARCSDCGPVITSEERAELDADYEADRLRRKRLGLIWHDA